MLAVKIGEEMDRKAGVPCFLKDFTMRERGGAESHDRQFHSLGFCSVSLFLSLCLSKLHHLVIHTLCPELHSYTGAVWPRSSDAARRITHFTLAAPLGQKLQVDDPAAWVDN